jgi:hypothetical protein
MDKIKFFGICILMASIVLSGAIIWHARMTADVGRYQFHLLTSPDYNEKLTVIDTKTGEVKTNSGFVLIPPADENKRK